MLIRNAEALERLEKVDTLVVDKTGTLTEGRPQVTAVEPAGAWPRMMMLRLAASLEQASEHPLAAAIVAAAAQARTGSRTGERLQGVDRQGRQRHASTAMRWRSAAPVSSPSAGSMRAR